MVLKMTILSGALNVANGNSFIDGTNGFVHTLVVCCVPVTTFSGSDFLFFIAFGTEFLAVGCLVLTSIGTLLGLWLLELMVALKRLTCTVSVAHAFVDGMGAGFLFPCLIVGLLGAGVHEVFALFTVSIFFGQSRLVVECLRRSTCNSGHRNCRS